MGEKLIFIRHAAVQIEPGIPAREWRLSDNGRSLSQQLAPKIAAHTPTRLITSQEPKARETGQIIADELNLPWQTAPHLHEHDREGVPFFESKEAFVPAVTHFFHHPDTLVFGNETANQAFTRFDTAVHHLITQHPSDTLAIVTHGTVLTLFLAHYNKMEPIVFWQTLKLPDFFVVNWPISRFTFHVLRYNNGRSFLNEQAHISNPQQPHQCLLVIYYSQLTISN